MGSLVHPKLPVIDFTNKNLEAGSSSWLSTREDVVRALEDCGCFIAIYDKVPFELHEAVVRASGQLFDVPTEIKTTNTSDVSHRHGYVSRLPFIPRYEGLDIENATTPEGAQKFTNRLFPQGNQPLSETLIMFSKIVAELDQMVMRMVSEKYGIEKHYDSLLGSTQYFLRFAKYRRSEEISDTTEGLHIHTDKSFTSFLQQIKGEGLEVRTKDGEWIPINDPSPSSFLVMAGDACMAWTNGRIYSPAHRVIVSEDKERYSLGVFTFLRGCTIQIPEELVDEQHPPQYNSFDHEKFLNFRTPNEEWVIKDYCGK